jgi:CRISPR/Cas system CSM-associated protein Csm4 (group 5 of RAMP superfamily)
MDDGLGANRTAGFGRFDITYFKRLERSYAATESVTVEVEGIGSVPGEEADVG